MGLYDRVADLPLTVESATYERRERETAAGFTRVTTTVELHGDGRVGRGEDVCYTVSDHDDYPAPALAGEYTFDGFTAALDDATLWPSSPARSVFRNYRRWAFESAALDLALRQADTHLAAAVGRDRTPPRFVISTRVESFDRIRTLLAVAPDAEFKVDPEPEWPGELLGRLAETGRVRVVDLKGYYEDADVETEASPGFYERVLAAFPEAIVEDPAVTDDTRPLFLGEEDRVAWDYPVTSVAALEERPWDPAWCNVKPSRFGSVRALLAAIEYCEEHDVGMYGGGQFELGVGRDQVQALASVFYPDAPNDVAPGGYNDEQPSPDLATSPLATSDDPVGFTY